jgi:AraC-like DNA-binding protein
MYEVRRACQEFYSMTFEAERHMFRDACTWLRHVLPAPESIQEVQALEDLALTCLTRAGTTFHADYHRTHAVQGPRCAGSPVDAAVQAWARSAPDPWHHISAWSKAYLEFLDATHPLLAAERAAEILRTTHRQLSPLGDLARSAGCSRSTLTHTFTSRYGMSCREYARRLSLRTFIELIRFGITAEAAAHEIGYAESHTVFTLLRKRTGLTPTELVPLSDDRLRVLMSERLPLVEPHCEDRATGDRHRRGTARPQRLE